VAEVKAWYGDGQRVFVFLPRTAERECATPAVMKTQLTAGPNAIPPEFVIVYQVGNPRQQEDFFQRVNGEGNTGTPLVALGSPALAESANLLCFDRVVLVSPPITSSGTRQTVGRVIRLNSHRGDNEVPPGPCPQALVASRPARWTASATVFTNDLDVSGYHRMKKNVPLLTTIEDALSSQGGARSTATVKFCPLVPYVPPDDVVLMFSCVSGA